MVTDMKDFVLEELGVFRKQPQLALHEAPRWVAYWARPVVETPPRAKGKRSQVQG